MKKLLLSFVLMVLALVGFAQMKQAATWSFSAKKLDATTYEIHMTATLSSGWHIYSQNTPEGGPVPTKIKFTNNPLVTLVGAAKEIGKMETKHEGIFGVDVKQFSNKVDFVQIVKLKGKIKTTLNGTIEYMTCNDKECLPPTTQKFNVAVQ